MRRPTSAKIRSRKLHICHLRDGLEQIVSSYVPGCPSLSVDDAVAINDSIEFHAAAVEREELEKRGRVRRMTKAEVRRFVELVFGRRPADR